MEPKNKKMSNFSKYLFLSIYGIILVFLFYFLVFAGLNPVITFLILLFCFILILGPVLGGMRKSLYSRMFSDKKKNHKGEYQKKKDGIKKEGQLSYIPPPRKRRPVNLNVKYRKPLIVKCENCKMTVASFVKKCPKCGEVVSS